MINSIRLTEDEIEILKIIMRDNNLKSKSSAIKKCIHYYFNDNNKTVPLMDINSKLNRIIYRDTLTKKLLEQFFANMGFQVNENVQNDECLDEFYKKHNKYQYNFLN